MAILAKTSERAKRERALDLVSGGSKHEPCTTEENYKMDLVHALNWYNAFRDEKNIRTYATEFVKKFHPSFSQVISKASDLELRQIGTLGRLIYRNQYISPEHILLISNQLNSLQQKYRPVKVKTVQSDSVNKISVQDRIKESADKHAVAIDEAIDDFISSKSGTFDTKQHLMTNDISGPVAKRIADLYQPLYNEITSTDPSIQEGYSNFTKLQMRRFVTFVKNILDACAQHGVSAVVRKPRVKKAKPAAVVTAKVQYMKEHPELGIKSVEPIKLVGSKEVWLYNVQYRKLSLLKGTDSGILEVRGTSLYNYDLELSGTKTIRDPATFFKTLAIGKRSLATAYKGITTKASPAKARLNDQTIILAVY